MSIADRCGAPHIHTLAEKRAIGKRLKMMNWMTPRELLADIDFVDEHGDKPLHEAARRGNASLVEKMVELGADVHYADSQTMRTPLMYACRVKCASVRQVVKYVETVKLLIARGSDCNALDLSKESPLHYAAVGGKSISRASLLLKHGAEIDATEQQGYTPLGYAAQFDNLEIVKFLLGCGADPSIASIFGQTPAMVAEQCGHFDIANVLQEGEECTIQ